MLQIERDIYVDILVQRYMCCSFKIENSSLVWGMNISDEYFINILFLLVLLQIL